VRAQINETTCQGCGLCEATAPEVFSVGDDGIAHVLVDVVPAGLEEDVRDAAYNCPTESISVSE
jgi:ferredoxin